MQKQEKTKKSKKIIIATLLILTTIAGLTVYILMFRLSSGSPLNNGNMMMSASGLTKINETISAGFSVWNSGSSPIRVEKVQVCFTDDQIALVEAVFVEQPPNQMYGSLQGTPEQNGYISHPVAGYIIEPQHEAQLVLALAGRALGYHSATKIIFTYTYQSLKYAFIYKIENYYALEVENS
jgi:hypothetical protein